jgi:hypothetical protein
MPTLNRTEFSLRLLENSKCELDGQTTCSLKFRFVFWDVLPFKKLSTDVSEVRASSIIALIPEDKSELHTRENFEISQTCSMFSR